MSKDITDSLDVTVLFPAAGEGRRIGGARKQFRTLGSAPLLVQTMRVFDRHPLVSRLIAVTLEDELETVRGFVLHHGFTKPVDVVPGGASRQESVRLGLHAVPASSEIVLIHDAVRPFVTGDEIARVSQAAAEYGAASVAIQTVDTLRRVSGGRFGPTVSREGLYRMQTPQGFRRSLIVQAHEAAANAGQVATDDVQLAQSAGYDVYVVDGSSENIKITTPADWRAAERMWESWSLENSS